MIELKKEREEELQAIEYIVMKLNDILRDGDDFEPKSYTTKLEGMEGSFKSSLNEGDTIMTYGSDSGPLKSTGLKKSQGKPSGTLDSFTQINTKIKK